GASSRSTRWWTPSGCGDWTCRSSAASFAAAGSLARRGSQPGQPAVAGRVDGHVRVGRGDLQLLPDDVGLLVLAQPGEAFVVAVQAPDVAGMLAGPGQGAVEPEVGPVDRFSFLDPALLEQQRAVGVPGGLHPAPRLVVGQPVLEFDRAAQAGEGRVVVSVAVFHLARQHGPRDLQDVLAGVVEQGA